MSRRIRTATNDERKQAVHITFKRTPTSPEGVVTGLPDRAIVAGPVTTDLTIDVFSAGCLHGDYLIEAGSTIVKIERYGA